MNCNCKWYSLQELVKIKYGKNQKKVQDNENGKYPIYGTGGLMGYSKEYLYNKPSVLIGRKGSISKVRYIEQPFWTVDTLFYTEVNENIVLPKYLYYKLSTINFDYYNEGTTIPSLRTDTLNKIELEIPNIEEQKKVITVLSSLDKKIELNNEMNKTLEEMSQSLFKRWFIDFEFTNEEGKPYKSSGGKMIQSEIGMIPEGWKVFSINDLVDSISIKHSFSKDKVIFLNTSDILEGQVLHDNYSDVNTLPGQAKKSIRMNDILYSEIRPRNKRYAYVDFECSDYVVSTKLMVLRAKSILSSILIYKFLTSEENIEYMQAIAESRSGTFPQITFKELSKLSIAIPDNINKLKEWDDIISSLFKKSQDNNRETKALTDIRDSLLPKLMSGKIKISDKVAL